jgi:hypothetical protein
VPVPIPTTDGRLFADGVVVMSYVEGGPPETEADWRRVADTLRPLHRLTQAGRSVPAGDRRPTSCTPRPGRRSTLGRCRLRALPDAEQRGRGSSGVGRASSMATPNNPGNVRMTADRVALIDWDEWHVDVPELDLVLPHNAAGLDDDAFPSYEAGRQPTRPLTTSLRRAPYEDASSQPSETSYEPSRCRYLRAQQFADQREKVDPTLRQERAAAPHRH